MKLPATPDPKTWDFAECPDDELRLCLYYEGAREVSVVKQYINSETYKTCKITAASLGSKYIAFTCSDFPDTPWLAIDKNVRRRYLKEAAMADDRQRGQYELVIPNYSMPEFVRMCSEDIDTSKLFEATDDPIPTIGIRPMPERNETWAALRLDWSKSKTTLIDDFKKLLNTISDHSNFSSKPPGRGSFRDYLNGLAAKRLRDHCKQHHLPKPVESALKMWQTLGPGHTRYNDDTAMRRAICKTTKFLETLYQLQPTTVDHREKTEKSVLLSVLDI